MKYLHPALLVLAALPVAATPCQGVDRRLTEEQKIQFSPAIERHLRSQFTPEIREQIRLEPKDILQLFRVGKWHIVYVANHVSDEPFLIYRELPQQSSGYIVEWAGAAQQDEGPAIQRWLEAQAAGIPKKLARCFAWHVSQARDM